MKRFCYKTFVIAGLLSSYGAGALAAPAVTTADQMRQMEEARRRQEEQQAQIGAPSVRLQGDAEVDRQLQLPAEEVGFLIKTIVVESDPPGSFGWTEKILEPYAHRRIGVQGVNMLAKLLSDSIIKRGYVTTRVVVPEQDITTGALRFLVIPGYIGNIRFVEENTWGSWRTAFPSRPGDILNIRSLEQGLEQLKRVPNQDAKMELLPGKKPGESDVVISISRTKPWSIGFSLDDSGLSSTGRLQGTANLAFYNPSGLNDVLSFSYGHDAENTHNDYGSDNYSLSYSVPYGNYTFNIGKYRSSFYQTVPSLTPFKSSSRTDTVEVGLQKTIYRNQTSKTQASFKIIKRDRHSYMDDIELVVQKQDTTAYQIGLMQRNYLGPTTIDAFLYYQKGIPWLGAKPGASDAYPEFGTTRYALWGGNFYLGTPMKFGKVEARYSLTVRAQYTGDALYATDQFSIGGRYTVRGFSGEQTLSAENGFVLRNELSFPLKKLKMEAYLGFDVGRVWGPADKYLPGKNLAGAVIGVRGGLFSKLQYDAFIGTPVYKPDGFKANKTALGFQIYLQF